MLGRDTTRRSLTPLKSAFLQHPARASIGSDTWSLSGSSDWGVILHHPVGARHLTFPAMAARHEILRARGSAEDSTGGTSQIERSLWLAAWHNGRQLRIFGDVGSELGALSPWRSALCGGGLVPRPHFDWYPPPKALAVSRVSVLARLPRCGTTKPGSQPGDP